MRGRLTTLTIALLLVAGPFIGMDEPAPDEPARDTANPERGSAMERSEGPPIPMAAPGPSFVENAGQIKDAGVRFYLPGQGLWFTDGGACIDIRDEPVDAGPAAGSGHMMTDGPAGDAGPAEVSGQVGNEGPTGRGGDVMDPGLVGQPVLNSQRDLGAVVPEPATQRVRGVVLRHEFVGGTAVSPEGREPEGARYSFIGGEGQGSQGTAAGSFGEIWYPGIYDGIDVRYYMSGGDLKYDIIVHPAGDVGDIRLRYAGADGVGLTDDGALKVTAGDVVVRDRDLYVYQDTGAGRARVSAGFTEFGAERVYGFELPDGYDPALDLIIDPLVALPEFSTFLGNEGTEYIDAIDTDAAGNIYIAGEASSDLFPTTSGAYDTEYSGGRDIFVSKLDPTGSQLLFSTYIGGTGSDYCYDMAVDKDGCAYVCGNSYSEDFPTTEDAIMEERVGYMDAYVLKLNSEGSGLEYCTFLAGSYHDNAIGIDVDRYGNACVVGWTSSYDFPTTTGAYNGTYKGWDGFIAQLNDGGTMLRYSTYFGGHGYDNLERVWATGEGVMYILGISSSSDFPVTDGCYCPEKPAYYGDSVLVVFDPRSSTLVYSTYLNTSYTDVECTGLAVDRGGKMYVTGYTGSKSLPVTDNAHDKWLDGDYDAFAMKLDPAGNGDDDLKYCTYIGGTDNDYGSDVKVDSMGNAVIVGYSNSGNFPTTVDALHESMGGLFDAFFLKLGPQGGSLEYCSFLGGSGNDYGRYVTLVDNVDVLMAGNTNSTNFPVTAGAYDTVINASYYYSELFISKFRFPAINITGVSLEQGGEEVSQVYSRYGIYTFKVVIEDPVSLDDVKTVDLIIDPGGMDLHLMWDRSTGEMWKEGDIMRYVELEATSGAFNDSWEQWSLYFEVNFNWTFPREGPVDVHVRATSHMVDSVWYNVTEMFSFENDLELTGNLLVKDSEGRRLRENELVGAGERLTLSGPVPIYQGSKTIHPLGGEYGIKVEDENGTVWKVAPRTGEECAVEVTVPRYTEPDGITFCLGVDGVPEECCGSPMNFTVRVDVIAPVFYDETPVREGWHTDDLIPVSVHMEDLGGGMVDGGTVEVSVSADNGVTWGDPVVVPRPSSGHLNVSSFVTVPDGRDNLIRWTATDTVGNGPSHSPGVNVMVDTNGVTFSDNYPKEPLRGGNDSHRASIWINDLVSGVDRTRVDYRTSSDNGKTWTDWAAVPVEGGKSVKAQVVLTLNEGSKTFIRWRAGDVAGNAVEQSPIYVIEVLEPEKTGDEPGEYDAVVIPGVLVMVMGIVAAVLFGLMSRVEGRRREEESQHEALKMDVKGTKEEYQSLYGPDPRDGPPPPPESLPGPGPMPGPQPMAGPGPVPMAAPAPGSGTPPVSGPLSTPTPGPMPPPSPGPQPFAADGPAPAPMPAPVPAPGNPPGPAPFPRPLGGDGA